MEIIRRETENNIRIDTRRWHYNNICKIVNLHRNTVSRAIKNHEDCVPFVTSIEKNSNLQHPQASWWLSNKLILNAVSYNNSIVIDELNDILMRNTGINLSRSNIARRLKNQI